MQNRINIVILSQRYNLCSIFSNY